MFVNSQWIHINSTDRMDEYNHYKKHQGFNLQQVESDYDSLRTKVLTSIVGTAAAFLGLFIVAIVNGLGGLAFVGSIVCFSILIVGIPVATDVLKNYKCQKRNEAFGVMLFEEMKVNPYAQELKPAVRILHEGLKKRESMPLMLLVDRSATYTQEQYFDKPAVQAACRLLESNNLLLTKEDGTAAIERLEEECTRFLTWLQHESPAARERDKLIKDVTYVA